MIAHLSFPLNGTVWSIYHDLAVSRKKCTFKRLQATIRRLNGYVLGCELRPPSQRAHKLIHVFIKYLIQAGLWFSQHLRLVIRPSELFMSFRLNYPQNRLVEKVRYTRRLRVIHSGLIHSKQLQTRIVPITSQSRGRSDRQGGQSGDNNI